MDLPDRQFLAELTTPRLALYCLSPAQLAVLLDDPAALERTLGFSVTREGLTPIVQRAIRMKIRKMETAARQDYAWFSYWLIQIRKVLFGAGLIGFKGIPPYPADVEIGYGIDPAYQKHGYITEAVRELVAWAFNDPRCTGIYAPVSIANPASSRVLEKVGFTRVWTNESILFWRLGRQEHADP